MAEPLKIASKTVWLGAVLLWMSATHAFADSLTIDALPTSSNAGYDFGQKIINWVTYGSESATTGAVSLLSTGSKVLCTIALFMMAVLAIWNGGMYVIHTANKGVPGGQIVSSFWMPLRIVVSTILLVPVPGGTGFSGLQYGVTWVAEMGNTHANVFSEAELNYLYKFGAYRPIRLINGEEVVFSWIGSEVCKQYINAYTGTNTITLSKSTVGSVADGFINKYSYGYNESASSFRASNPRTDYCGSITLQTPKSGSIEVQKAGPMDFTKHNSIQSSAAAAAQASMISLLDGLQPEVAEIAGTILSDQSALLNMQANGTSAQSQFEAALKSARANVNGLGDKISSVISKYNEGRQEIISQAVNSANTGATDGSDWKTQTIDGGWPLLGTIFWQVQVTQGQINSLAQLLTASSTDPQLDGEWLQDQRLQEIAQRLVLARSAYSKTGKSVLTTAATDDDAPIPSLSAIAMAGSDGGFFDTAKMALFSALSGVVKKALFYNSPDDLLLNIQYMGSAIGTSAEMLYMEKAAVITGITVAASTTEQAGQVASAPNIFNFINPIALGARAVSSLGPITKDFIRAISEQLLPFVDTVLTILIVLGFIAAVVLPTIPLTIWFMGVISWMLFYIECLLVSNFWLAAHGTAEREGWGTEHTRQGYMLMIGLYLNPILRVAGFFAIFIALKPVSYLVYWFFDYVHGVLTSGFTFIFLPVGGVAVCLMFTYTAVVRVFGLPSELFERGLRWVNGGQEVTGDGHTEEKIRNNYMAFAQKAEAAGGRGFIGSASRAGQKDASGGNSGSSPPKDNTRG